MSCESADGRREIVASYHTELHFKGERCTRDIDVTYPFGVLTGQPPRHEDTKNHQGDPCIGDPFVSLCDPLCLGDLVVATLDKYDVTIG